MCIFADARTPVFAAVELEGDEDPARGGDEAPRKDIVAVANPRLPLRVLRGTPEAT